LRAVPRGRAPVGCALRRRACRRERARCDRGGDSRGRGVVQRRAPDRAAAHRAPARARASRRPATAALVIERQHVWHGPEATSFVEPCEACLSLRESLATDALLVHGTLRPEADVGFTTCRRGHRIVVRRVARELARRSLLAAR